MKALEACTNVEFIAIILRLGERLAGLGKRHAELEAGIAKLRKNSSTASEPSFSDIVKPSESQALEKGGLVGVPLTALGAYLKCGRYASFSEWKRCQGGMALPRFPRWWRGRKGRGSALRIGCGACISRRRAPNWTPYASRSTAQPRSGPRPAQPEFAEGGPDSVSNPPSPQRKTAEEQIKSS